MAMLGILAMPQQTVEEPPAAPTGPSVAASDKPQPSQGQQSQGRVDADDETTFAFNSIFNAITQFVNVATVSTPKQQDFRLINRSRISTTDQTAAVTINEKIYPLRAYKLLLTPNDPSATQWWTTGTKLPQSWDITTGSSDTTIAIIDTGFALAHEEFSNRWYQNAGETGPALFEATSRLNCTDRGLAVQASCNLVDDDLDGIVDNESGTASYQNPSNRNCTAQGKPLTKDCNNIDDDNNGFIDDVTGWDFMNQDRSVQAGQLNPGGSGTMHGTMVAGVAAATGNNGRGIAGVNWGTKILPIQALDDDGYGDTVSVGQSIYYAIGQGVDVISISLGTAYNDTFVQEAIGAATKAGIVVVAASGNDGCECISYPAKYPEVISVGALTSSNVPASFSSWGADLDILAPGADIRTTTWSASNATSSYASGVAGTSFAAPYIAGLMASMKSLQPESNPLQLIGGLGESTVKSANMTAQPLDSRYGFGISSALNSVSRMSVPKTDLQVYRFSPVQSGAFLNKTAQYEVAGTYSAHACSTGNGTTPIFELTKGTATFFSISRVEVQKARSQGYAVSRFAYSCIQQNHDTYTLARLIDIFKEFRNDYSRRE